VVLRPGLSKTEQREKAFGKQLDLVRSAGLVREDGVLRRKVTSGWAW
jgi:large subunit ribosomal protein L22